jgi:hypothetical protein
MGKYKPAFQVGDWVRASYRIYFGYNGPDGKYMPRIERRMFKIKEDFIGQICGATYRWEEGKRDGGGWEEPPSFTGKKQVLVWQIKTSITGKPLEALEEDIRLVNAVEGSSLPFRSDNTCEWAEADKESLRQEMKHWPRDEKGRWMKAEHKPTIYYHAPRPA